MGAACYVWIGPKDDLCPRPHVTLYCYVLVSCIVKGGNELGTCWAKHRNIFVCSRGLDGWIVYQLHQLFSVNGWLLSAGRVGRGAEEPGVSVTSDFRHDVNEIFALLGCYAANIGSEVTDLSDTTCRSPQCICEIPCTVCSIFPPKMPCISSFVWSI
jgi:hypothetical protein